MEKTQISRHLTTAVLATILVFSAMFQLNIIRTSSSENETTEALATIVDSAYDLVYMDTEEPAEEYFGFIDVEIIELELKGESELKCTITVREGPLVDLEYPGQVIFYTLMLDEDNDPEDNCQNHPFNDVDTMYSVAYTHEEGWLIVREKYQIVGGWSIEDTDAGYGLASSFPGGFSISMWIPLTELAGFTEILPWKVNTETHAYPPVFPATGDFVPDEGLSYLPPIPPEGIDILDVDCELELEIFDVGVEDINLEGPIAIVRGKPGDSDEDGLIDIETEIVSMRLTGDSEAFGPIEIHISPDKASNGLIEVIEPDINSPVEVSFEITIEITPAERKPLVNPLKYRVANVGDSVSDSWAVFDGVSAHEYCILCEKLDPEIALGQVNNFSLLWKQPVKEIKLAFHIPEDVLEQKNLTENDMEELIDKMLEGVNKIWKPANISFIKAKLEIGNFTKHPDEEERDQLRENATKEQPSFLPVFLVESFPDKPGGTLGLSRKTGIFLSQRGWTDDPDWKNDDNDPEDGWNGEDPPDEVLAHELGHGLCLEHYEGRDKRHKLLHEYSPCGITLNPDDIKKARNSALAHKYEPTRTDPEGDYIDPVCLPHHDALCSIVTVDTIEDSLNLGMGIKVADCIPVHARENDGYSFVIDTDDNPTTGAEDPLLRGGEALASLRYKADVGWMSELNTYNTLTQEWTLIGTCTFEVFYETGFAFVLVPMDAIGVSEGALITWKSFTQDRGDLVDVTGYVIMKTIFYSLPTTPEHSPQILTPTADFTFTPSHPRPWDEITFDASPSCASHESHTIITFEWDFDVENGRENGTGVSYAFAERGVYTVNLTITDDIGLQSWTIQTLFVSILGDLNADGIVNIVDVFIVARAFGTKPGDERWDFLADMNDDYVVNIIDIYIVARNYGKTEP